MFPQQYNSKARFAVASKEAGLGFGERDIQLLTFVSVFGKAQWACGGRVDAVMPWFGQRYGIAGGVVEELAFLPTRILLVGGEGSVCVPRIGLVLDMDCL